MQQHLGGYAGKKVAWIGDGNNMANSWLDAAALLGFELRLACPEGYEPDHAVYERARQLTRTLITEDTDEAAEGADVVTTDVWASMGQEGEAEKRKLAFKGYVVDQALMKLAKPDAIFLHCLPAPRRGGDGRGNRGAAVQGVRRGGTASTFRRHFSQP